MAVEKNERWVSNKLSRLERNYKKDEDFSGSIALGVLVGTVVMGAWLGGWYALGTLALGCVIHGFIDPDSNVKIIDSFDKAFKPGSDERKIAIDMLGVMDRSDKYKTAIAAKLPYLERRRMKEVRKSKTTKRQVEEALGKALGPDTTGGVTPPIPARAQPAKSEIRKTSRKTAKLNSYIMLDPEEYKPEEKRGD